ncbi:30S ribosomal protein S9 [Rhynchospora pubera]|uniref:Small ribosomal subunit protein uS9c n=1 Tax=Rhynchospora pubera TaxID=906938 RepID=A0AAV8GCN0_9POAL|nr:30S ribosomal protein S9 [Rhynchospora pubera]
MALSISSLTSSFTSLSFSHKAKSKPFAISFVPSRRFTITASASDTESIAEILANAAEAAARITPTRPELPGGMSVEKYMKSRLPGGIAAQEILTTGRRKCAVARVALQEGNGKIIVNYRDAKDYFQGNAVYLQYLTRPLVALGLEKRYDIFVKTHGGGLSGQAQAVCLGVARALLKISEENRPTLRNEGLLTRDARIVERKKAGFKKARKREQFSKR